MKTTPRFHEAVFNSTFVQVPHSWTSSKKTIRNWMSAEKHLSQKAKAKSLKLGGFSKESVERSDVGFHVHFMKLHSVRASAQRIVWMRLLIQVPPRTRSIIPPTTPTRIAESYGPSDIVLHEKGILWCPINLCNPSSRNYIPSTAGYTGMMDSDQSRLKECQRILISANLECKPSFWWHGLSTQ